MHQSERTSGVGNYLAGMRVTISGISVAIFRQADSFDYQAGVSAIFANGQRIGILAEQEFSSGFILIVTRVQEVFEFIHFG